jgi:uncharacterized surface protein with fasciclin (FAS1) repeats
MVGVLAACTKNSSVSSSASSGSTTTINQNLLQRIKNNYDFSEFYSALLRVHLDTLLEGAGPYTVLLPDNVALQAQGISADSLQGMDSVQLRKLLLYHILPGNITYESVPQELDYVYHNMDSLPLYFSEPIPGAQQQQQTNPQYAPILDINGVKVSTTDVLASNGVIQVMASMLNYPVQSVGSWLESNPNYTEITEAFRRWNLLPYLDTAAGPFTILAPSDAAFQYWGITMDSIDIMTPAVYSNWLFQASVMPKTLFFRVDMYDGPVEGEYNGWDWYLNPKYAISFQAGSSFWIAVAYPPNYEQQMLLGNYEYSWGDYCDLADPDHLAMNGIVHGLDGILIYPDSAMTHP